MPTINLEPTRIETMVETCCKKVASDVSIWYQRLVNLFGRMLQKRSLL